MSDSPSAKAAQQICHLFEQECGAYLLPVQVEPIIQQALSDSLRPYRELVEKLRKQAWLGEGSEQYRMGLGHAANELEALINKEAGK